MELGRIFLVVLGRALCSILHDEPPAVHSPLPSLTSCVNVDCWRCSELCAIGDNQLPSLHPRTKDPAPNVPIFRYWAQGANYLFSEQYLPDCHVRLHGTFDVWDTWVSYIFLC